jgi:hypothetical protein
MHSLISDFTMLDVLRMVPKLTVRLQAACRSRYQHFGETAAGYSHTYFDDDDAPSHLFSQFPSNQAIDSLAKDAYGEATYLWSLLGYDPCEAPIQHKPQPADSVSGCQLLSPSVNYKQNHLPQKTRNHENGVLYFICIFMYFILFFEVRYLCPLFLSPFWAEHKGRKRNPPQKCHF